MKKTPEQNNLHNAEIVIKGIRSRFVRIDFLSVQVPRVLIVIIAIGCGAHLLTPGTVQLLQSVVATGSVR